MSNFPLSNNFNLAGYPFAELERTASKRKAAGLPLYDLSIGDPDLQPPEFVVRAIIDTFRDERAHVYPSSRGDLQTRQSIAKWFFGRFGVALNPDTQICILIGAKEGLAQVARVFINPGDVVGVPQPGYPVYGRSGCQIVGGKPKAIPLSVENNFLPDLKTAEGVKLLYLNYPNNPTGATADVSFLKDLADYNQNNPQTIIAYDMAYSEVTFGEPSHSLLEFTPNVLEFHSMSKMANATGFRIGFVAGHPDLIAGIVKSKEEMDSGAPLPFQRGLAALLDRYDGKQPPQEILHAYRVYDSRKQKLIKELKRLGLRVFESKATFYIWFEIGEDELSFVSRAAQQGLLLTPGSGFGSGGKGWVRASVTTPDKNIDAAVEVLSKIL